MCFDTWESLISAHHSQKQEQKTENISDSVEIMETKSTYHGTEIEE